MKIWCKAIISASFLALVMSVQNYAFAEFRDQPDPPTNVREDLPFSLTISGGISLGSYEAGVNWALIEFLKKMRNDSRYKRKPSLTAVTGASAGAINAVISAMLWCVDEDKISDLEDKLEHPKETQNEDPKKCQRLLPQRQISVDNNILREAWVSVGIDQLVPRDEGKYCGPGTRSEKGENKTPLVDTLFARSAFERSVAMIRALYESRAFRPNESVKIAMLATREKPIEVDVDGIKVKNQRHVFVLTFKTDENGRGYFVSEKSEKKSNSGEADNSCPAEENTNIDSGQGAVVYLPHVSKDGNSEVPVGDVIRLMYASSAFPVAFGKVNLSYCTKERESRTESGDRCPDGTFLTSADFIDGGVFDNVPLGAAQALLGSKAKCNYFFFISPSTRRNVPEPFKDPLWRKPRTFGIKGMLEFAPGFFAAAADHELYTVLRSGNWRSYIHGKGDDGKGKNKLVVTDRYFPITGAFLGHFGAFLDRPFREFDYGVGVYDAVHDLARFVRHVDESLTDELDGEYVEKVYETTLGKDTKGAASEVFALIATQEHGNEYVAPNSGWRWINDELPDSRREPDAKSEPDPNCKPDPNRESDPMHIIFKSIIETSKVPTSDDDDSKLFNKFVERLHVNRFSNICGHSDQMKWILKKHEEDYTEWYSQLVGRATKRLQVLQSAESDITGKKVWRYVAAGASLGLGRFFDYDKKLSFQPTSVPETGSAKSKSTARKYRGIPYEVAFDTANGGGSISYLLRWRPWDSPLSLDLKLIPAGISEYGEEWRGFSQSDLYLTGNKLGGIWTIGAGPTVNYLWSKTEDFHRGNWGAAGFVEIFKTLRFTYGFRRVDGDEMFGKNDYFTLGIVDVPGLVNRWWFK